MKRRLAGFLLIPLGILSSGSFARSGAFEGNQLQAATRELRVMSYNIKHGQTNAPCEQPQTGPGQPAAAHCNLDLEAAAAVIRTHAPDIVLLQEVDRFWARSADDDQPATLAASLDMHPCYGANLDHDPDSHAGKPHQYGTLILSRFSILECTNTLLPRTDDNEQRGLTRADVDIDGVTLRVYNTHLHTTAADRLLQTEAIVRIMDWREGRPTLLAGDFNARPGAQEMAPITARLRDVWLEAGRATPDNPDGLTAAAQLSGAPTNRIDYIFASPHVAIETAFVPTDSQTRLASDHYPVVADIVLSLGDVR